MKLLQVMTLTRGFHGPMGRRPEAIMAIAGSGGGGRTMPGPATMQQTMSYNECLANNYCTVICHEILQFYDT